MRELKILFDLKMAFAKAGNEIVAKDRSEITAFRYKEVSFKIIGFICMSFLHQQMTIPKHRIGAISNFSILIILSLITFLSYFLSLLSLSNLLYFLTTFSCHFLSALSFSTLLLYSLFTKSPLHFLFSYCTFTH